MATAESVTAERIMSAFPGTIEVKQTSSRDSKATLLTTCVDRQFYPIPSAAEPCCNHFLSRQLIARAARGAFISFVRSVLLQSSF